MSQQLRPSQFITTYGPGSVVETPAGPGVIPSLDRTGLYDRADLNELEIRGTRLESVLGANASVVRVPSNADLRIPEDWEAGKLEPFPKWSLCPDHSIIYRSWERCPRCQSSRGRSQAIRFVMACRDGHLDDVNWPSLVDHRSEHGRPTYMLWRGRGALRNVQIECPTCGATRNLGDAYNRQARCSGHFPDRGSARPGCPRPARMLQRGAANLRLVELVSALTIPPRDSELDLLLQSATVSIAVKAAGVKTKRELMDALVRLGNQCPADVRLRLDRFDEDQIAHAITSLLEYVPPSGQPELLSEELEALRRGADQGAPPTGGDPRREQHQFEMPQSSLYDFETLVGRVRVSAVTRLRVVLAQIGYRRVNPLDSEVVSVAAAMGGRNWYPGVEVFGEGVFLMLTGSQSIPAPCVARARRMDPLTPEHLWWHSLSHRILRVISKDSGYSAAAIRERVYAPPGLTNGGLLLYTAQPGGDGTLGGLAAMAPAMDRILASAVTDLSTCSNDPLCLTRQLAAADVNGAACYACMFASETSCEHRNTGLDRVLLLEWMRN